MPLDLLLFAAIAAFFIWKLRQALGTRTGEEQHRDNPFAAPPAEPPSEPRSPHEAGPSPVIEGQAREVPAAAGVASRHPVASVAGGLAQIYAVDPAFDEKAFLIGARQAYTMIVEAFAKADRAALKTMLTPAVYDGFEGELTARAARGETLETRVHRILVAEISAARLDGAEARVTVDFTSEQISVTRKTTGEVCDGDPTQPIEVAEAWTFTRAVGSGSPDWHLVATRPL